MEYRIGEEVELRLRNSTNEVIKLKIEEKSDCENCFFFNINENRCIQSSYCGILGSADCDSLLRRDKKSIIYKLIK